MAIIYFDSIDSTNTYAINNLNNLKDKDLVIAQEQLTGKGRNNKVWHSPKKGNIYASYIVKNCDNILLQSSWIGGLATLKTLQSLELLDNLWIKWPNDIYYKDKKICGVLCESVLASPNSKIKETQVVIGIGININCTEDDLKDISRPCTSVFIESGIETDLKSFYHILKTNLDFFYDKILSEGVESIYQIWKKENKLIGRKICVELTPNNILEFKVLDINKNGALIGVDKEGNIKTIYSGDVSIKSFQ